MIDAISPPDGTQAIAAPGDPVACLKCAAVMTIDRSGVLRPFTETEANALMEDAELVRALRRLVGAIRVIRAGRN
jgi:hypothetical protein